MALVQVSSDFVKAAALTRRPVDALASNVCGSVLGLLMMPLAWTYFPPTCWMTSAYSLSAPTAMIVPSAGAGRSAKEDEQPAASRATAARAAAAAGPLQRCGMAGFSPWVVRVSVALLVMIMILNLDCNAVGGVGGGWGGFGVVGAGLPATLIAGRCTPPGGYFGTR